MIDLLNYIIAACSTALPAIGVALGQSKATNGALMAIAIQPSSKKEISRALLLGLAVIETSAIIGLVIALLTIKSKTTLLPTIAITLIAGLGFLIGYFCSHPVKEACFAIARQPFSHTNITNSLLLGLSFLQTPIIFGFVVSLIINHQADTDIANGLRLLGASIALCAGSSGAIISMSEFNAKICEMIGLNRKNYKPIFNFSLVSQAMIETPVLLSLVVGLIIVSMNATSVISGFIMLAAGSCTGISSIAPGLGSGKVAAAGAEEIGKNLELKSAISRTTIFAQAFLDTFVIYGLIISLLILIK